MSNNADSAFPATSSFWMDGFVGDALVDRIADARGPQGDTRSRYWISAERPIQSERREILEIAFSGQKLINHIAYEVSHFPVTVKVQWLDEYGKWNPVEYRVAHEPGPHRERVVAPLDLTIRDSKPLVIPIRPKQGDHPLHFGPHHWYAENRKVMPILTSRVRLVMERYHKGQPPISPNRYPLAYSLAVKELKVGYRIDTADDVPDDTYLDDEFLSSTDLLGSPVTLGTFRSGPDKAIDGDPNTSWRCEPQPINFAVVNFYLDSRTPDGKAQTVDRFFIDPYTTGVLCNLYYSSDEPDSTYRGERVTIDYPLRQDHGFPRVVRDGRTNTPTMLRLSSTEPCFSELNNEFLRFRQDRAWWLGVVGKAAVDATGLHPDDTTLTTEHTWMQMGGVVLKQEAGTLVAEGPEGQRAEIALPDYHQEGTNFAITLSYHPPTPTDMRRMPYLRLLYQGGNNEPIVEEVALPSLHNPYSTLNPGNNPFPVIRIGAGVDGETPGIPSIGLRGLVLKEERLRDDWEEWFLDEREEYVRGDRLRALDRHSTDNAVLRVHPEFWTENNQFGIVGGPGDRFAEMEWTPILGEYSVRQGFMYVPPTKARYWKFEFTRLQAEHYEVFVPISRTVKVHTAVTVKHYDDLTDPHKVRHDTRREPRVPDSVAAEQDESESGRFKGRRNAHKVRHDTRLLGEAEGGRFKGRRDVSPNKVRHDTRRVSGSDSQVELSQTNLYADAIDALRFASSQESDSVSVTEAMVVSDPVRAAEIAKTGWIWTYAPWHQGRRAPMFIQKQRHFYETVEIKHRTKIGFFVGLRSLSAMRVDYMAIDDTDEYHEAFVDDQHISSMVGMEQGDGTLTSIGSFASVTSEVFHSREKVRGLQFASQENEGVQVLADPGFYQRDLGYYWKTYGDATLDWQAPGRVLVARGWIPNTYLRLSRQYHTYGAMEGLTYGGLEGSDPESGQAGGGIESLSYSPSRAGRLTAAVEVSTDTPMSGPVVVEIVSVDDFTVLAKSERWLSTGTPEQMEVGYSPGATSIPFSYEDTEARGTYGDLEAFRYVDLESVTINPDVFIRVRQIGQFSDRFLVHSIRFYDRPVVWSFSVDGGSTWWDAMDVRNEVSGALMFPVAGTQLRWKARIFRPDITISDLVIRPWYGSRARSSGHHEMETMGPTDSPSEAVPSLSVHPMWQSRFSPFSEALLAPATAPPGSLLWYDPFTGPDSDTLGERSDYQISDQWQFMGPGHFEIEDNIAVATDLDLVIPTIAYVDPGMADAYWSVTFPQSEEDLAATYGLIFRGNQTLDSYWLARDDGLYQVSGDDYIEVEAWTLSGGDTVRIVTEGTSITIIVNGAEFASTNSDFNVLETIAGLWALAEEE